jgi:hypothetical protein
MVKPSDITWLFPLRAALGTSNTEILVFSSAEVLRHDFRHLREAFRSRLDIMKAFRTTQIFFSDDVPHIKTSCVSVDQYPFGNLFLYLTC